VSAINDSVQHVTLDTACRHTVHMWRIQEASVLVVAVDSRVPKEEYFPHIEEALELIEQGKLSICICTLLFLYVINGLTRALLTILLFLDTFDSMYSAYDAGTRCAVAQRRMSELNT